MNTLNNNYNNYNDYYNYNDYDDYDDYDNYTYLDDLFNDLLIELIILSLLNTSTNTNILNTSLYERNPVKNVITDEVKNNLQSIKFKDIINKENNTSCAITQDEFSDEDMVIQLQCSHCFNNDAILHWLTEESCECPVCRYKLESKEKISLLNVTTNTNTNTITDYIIQYYFY
jgi:hypothetical protein